MPCLRARKTADAGLYQFIAQNKAIMDLFKQHFWVEEMVRASGERLKRRALARRRPKLNRILRER